MVEAKSQLITFNQYTFDKEEIKKITIEYIRENLDHLTRENKTYFLNECVRCGLNPFKREAHPSTYGNKFQVLTGYEVYIRRAQFSGLCNGFMTVYNDTDNMDKVLATITIHRKGWDFPVIHSVAFSEYAQRKKDGELTRFWKDKPRTMLTKVAISQGFRLAFSEVVEGLPYIEEEIKDQQNLNLKNKILDEAQNDLDQAMENIKDLSKNKTE